MTAPADTQRHRAIANALWPHLKRGQWREHTTTRAWSPTGNPPTGRDLITSSGFPTPTPTTELLTSDPYIVTYVWPEEWPGATAWRIELTLTTHHNTLREHPHLTIPYLTLLKLAKCRAPFTLDTNRHGTPTLRRNPNETHLTSEAAQALQRIAAAATTQRIPDDVLDALITDSDISSSAVEAIAQRAGVGKRGP